MQYALNWSNGLDISKVKVRDPAIVICHVGLRGFKVSLMMDTVCQCTAIAVTFRFSDVALGFILGI